MGTLHPEAEHGANGMRLSNSNDRKLTQMIWRERARRAGMAGIAVLGLGAAAMYLNHERALRNDPTVEVKTVQATVVPGVLRANNGRGYIFHARMADGHDVDAWSAAGVAPQVGLHVLLAQTLSCGA